MSAKTQGVLRPTPRYHRVLGRADEIARATGSPNVGPEHLLLAIIHEGQSVPAQVLARLADLDRAEAALLDMMNSPAYSRPGSPHPAQATPAQARGVRIAATMGHSHMGVEHLFLGMIGDRDSAVCLALSRVVDLGAAEAAVVDVMNSPAYHGEPGATDIDRVFLPDDVELDRPLTEAILASLPEGGTYGVNVENGRMWVRVSGPRNTRDVLNAALARLGRPPLN